MKECDILIIGGGPAGMVSSMSCRAYYPDKKVIVVKSTEQNVVPCGIPYVFGNKLDSLEDDFVPCGEMALKNKIELLIDVAVGMNYDTKTVILASSEKIKYDKLIIATGSTPRKVAHDNIKGVHYISKDPKELKATYKDLKSAQNIIIVGTGFIGLEVALELYEKTKAISLVGKQLLGKAFDSEFKELIEKIILKDDINHYKTHLKEIKETNGRVSSIITDDGDEISCDTLIIAVGYVPNTLFAKNAGISLRDNFIYVDEYMRTTKKDIFAVGDCAQKRDFVTKRTTGIMLASTAAAEARTAISALYGIKYSKTFSGTIAIFSTVMGNTCFASAGVTQEMAQKEELDIEMATVIVDDKHPSKLPNSRKQTIKLICMKRSGVVIGAQIIGGMDVGEMINVIGVVIENHVSIYSLINLQVATHPLLTSTPTSYPIAKAAQMLDIKINKQRS